MTTLEDISERLLTRSQEAILQLELWIQRQQHLRELEDDPVHKLSDDYNMYIAQLNSLCVRSEYVRDKLNKERERRLSLLNDRKYIENLVFEFQKITVKLNDLACAQSTHSTPSSKSTRSSLDSFQPRPLKISERHQLGTQPINESPTRKKSLKKSVAFVPVSDAIDNQSSRCFSLPGSPIKNDIYVRSVRLAKSYDTGLNSKTMRRVKENNTQDIHSFFKENQRLSISFCDDLDEDLDVDSDQDTVISVPPACHDKLSPLRRYNSHESILSTKIQPLSQAKSLSSFLLPTPPNRPSINSTRISSEPIFSRNSTPTSSKDLLSTFVSKQNFQSEDRAKNKQGSVFARWNLFGNSSAASQITQVSAQNPMKIINSNFRQQIKLMQCYERPFQSLQSAVKGPVFDSMVSYDDLSDALNTELVLKLD